MNNIGTWFNKNNPTDFILIFDPDEQPPEGYTQTQPLPGIVYQSYDDTEEKWIADPNAETLARIDECKAELAVIDREAGAGRAVRGLALAAAEAANIESADFDKLLEYENRAEALRAEIQQLSA